jgi:hypothetical protein
VLKSLDILIAFSAVMLLVSAAVTLLTQAVAGALGWRSGNLLRGIITILNQVDPKIMPFSAKQIANAVLRHPLIARAEGKAGAVIQREELTRILLELAAGREPGGKSLDEYARSTLKRTVEAGGVANPAVVLDNIHLLGLKLEALHPELPAAARQSLAVITEAPSQFAGRIHACFDETMDRITERFGRHTRLVAGAIAIAVALGMQLDTFELLRDGVNAHLVVPRSWIWSAAKVPGIALSAMLLSLGAPFWYNALKDLIGLRPVLARKEEEHRDGRQAAFYGSEGEKGDLSTTGAAG